MSLDPNLIAAHTHASGPCEREYERGRQMVAKTLRKISHESAATETCIHGVDVWRGCLFCITDAQIECDECGRAFTPENQGDSYCDTCLMHDRNDRSYQFGESER